ncbi:hypothetical protein [Streptomyces chartreusis]|uniref:hypothetical protein n=1 Tax=Streptomyces chartreusis TaxID=1969 RepID=UPI003AF1A819
MHATASGNAVLAYLGKSEIAEVTAGTLEGYGEETITGPGQLRAELGRVSPNWAGWSPRRWRRSPPGTWPDDGPGAAGIARRHHFTVT